MVVHPSFQVLEQGMAPPWDPDAAPQRPVSFGGGCFGGRFGGGRSRAAFCQVPSGWHPLNGTYLDSAALAKEAGCTPASE